MKKSFTFLSALLMVVGLVGCGVKKDDETSKETETTALADDPYKVATPMEHPVYSFDHEPTTDELREMVVKAMHDELSVEWYTPEAFKYNKTGAASNKLYEFESLVHYAGLPYADPQRSVYAMLEYIDGNGRLNVDKVRKDSGLQNLGQGVNEVIGNTCCGSTTWAMATCCNSIGGPGTAYNCVVKNGYYPLGEIQYDESITRFNSANGTSTYEICQENGEDVIYDAYSKALRADLMVVEELTPGKEHATMVIENHVVMGADGKVNPEESYIVIQDQHVGLFKASDANGKPIQYVGHTDENAVKRSYREWFQIGYIPVTTAELMGTKAYEKPEVKLSQELKTSEDMQKCKITSNYPIAMLKVTAGSEEAYTYFATREDIGTREAFNVGLSRALGAVKKLGVKEGAEIKIEVTLSNGEITTYTVAY